MVKNKKNVAGWEPWPRKKITRSVHRSLVEELKEEIAELQSYLLALTQIKEGWIHLDESEREENIQHLIHEKFLPDLKVKVDAEKLVPDEQRRIIHGLN